MIDPITLLTVGPSIIKGIGRLFGGKTNKKATQVAEKVGDTVGKVGKLPASKAIKKINDVLESLPDDELKQLDNIKGEIYTAASGLPRFGELNKAQTRPKIALLSARVGFGYIIVAGVFFPVINAVLGAELPGLDWAILSAIFGPVFAYMGMRTLDKRVGND